ncbi:MAG: XdhC family protein [Caldisericaceae bacterium]
MYQIYEKMVELINNHSEFVLAIVVNAQDSTSGKSGFKMIILPDGTTYGTVGGGGIEKEAIEISAELFKTHGTAFRKHILKEGEETSLGMVCGGEIEIYLEYIGSPQQLVIFGAGHLGKMLYDIARLSKSYEFIIVDDREELATRERFPDAQVFTGADIYKSVDALPIRNGAIVVIVTLGGIDDPYILQGLAQKDVKYSYIGMIGSTGRRNKCFSKATELGVKDEFIKQIFAPVGIDINGDTPFEISIAILAEIIANNKGSLDNVKTERSAHEGY